MMFRLPGKTDDARVAWRLKTKLSLSGTVGCPVPIQAAQVHPTGSLAQQLNWYNIIVLDTLLWTVHGATSKFKIKRVKLKMSTNNNAHTLTVLIQ